MKRLIAIALFILALGATAAFAQQDYSTMTNEDLSTLRGTFRDATPEERDAFRTEWRTRMDNMTPEERALYAGRPANAPRDGQGFASGRGNGYGRGMGMGPGGGNGQCRAERGGGFGPGAGRGR